MNSLTKHRLTLIGRMWPLFIVVCALVALIWSAENDYTPPGVGTRCQSCKQECDDLGKKLNTETVYTGRCWVKNWTPASN